MKDTLRCIAWMCRNPKTAWAFVFNAWVLHEAVESFSQAMEKALKDHQNKNPEWN